MTNILANLKISGFFTRYTTWFLLNSFLEILLDTKNSKSLTRIFFFLLNVDNVYVKESYGLAVEFPNKVG